MEGDDAPRADGDFFAGLGVAPGPLRLVAQLEVAEAGELHALAALQRLADFLEKASTMSLASRLFSPTFSNSRSASSAFVNVMDNLKKSVLIRVRTPHARSFAPNRSCSRLANLQGGICLRIRQGFFSILQ